MSNVPTELKYNEAHDWIQIEGDIATVGITDHAQSCLGDITYIELPQAGQTLQSGDDCVVVESLKAASEIVMPLSGEILEVNEAIVDAPETVNKDPYGQGWFFRIRISNPAEADSLMDAEAYKELL
jgi:glycine cleavage system H protein